MHVKLNFSCFSHFILPILSNNNSTSSSREPYRDKTSKLGVIGIIYDHTEPNSFHDCLCIIFNLNVMSDNFDNFAITSSNNFTSFLYNGKSSQ